MPTSAEVELGPDRQQALEQLGVERHLAAGHAPVHVAVAEGAAAEQALALALARDEDALAHLLRPCAPAVIRAHELDRRHGLDLADEVDPVHERAAQPPLVAPELDRRAGAVPVWTRTRAAVAGRDDHGIGGELERPLPAHDLDPPLLERLPERIDGRAAELGELVEKEHAPVGERDLARPRRCPSTD